MEYFKQSIVSTVALLSLSLLVPANVHARTAGPDTFGNIFSDSNEPDCTAQFVDITPIGTNLALTDDEERVVTTPFPITLYGRTSDQLMIGNNGALALGAQSADISAENVDLPTNKGAFIDSPGIMPFWDDFDDNQGGVYTAVTGVSPHRSYLIQWADLGHYNNGTDGVNFEVIFYEDSPKINFIYNDVMMSNTGWDFGASATIGISNGLDDALKYSFDEATILTGAEPVSAICFDRSIACPLDAPASDIKAENFDSDNGGGSATLDWEWGIISNNFPVGLGGAYSGDKGWATVLDGPYNNLGATSTLTFNIDLRGETAPISLEWYQYLHAINSNYDWARIFANDVMVYDSTDRIDETAWTHHFVNLDAFAGQQLKLEFMFYATGVVNDDGWYVDSMKLQRCGVEKSTFFIIPTRDGKMTVIGL